MRRNKVPVNFKNSLTSKNSEKNIKITTVEDLEMIKALMHTSKEAWLK